MIALLSAVFAACTDTEASTGMCKRPPQATLVFLDQSASAHLDAHTKSLFSDSLLSIANHALECPGDGLHAFVAHQQTTSKAYRQDVVHQLPLPDSKGKPKGKAAAERMQYQAKLKKLRADAASKLTGLFGSKVQPAFAHRTDLIGTLQVASDELAKVPAGTTSRLYYFSDMNESMVGSGRRDFDKRPPTSKAEAQAWADADRATLKQLSLDPSRLNNAEVRVLMGTLATKPHASDVRFYWERLFQHAGLDPARVRYN